MKKRSYKLIISIFLLLLLLTGCSVSKLSDSGVVEVETEAAIANSMSVELQADEASVDGEEISVTEDSQLQDGTNVEDSSRKLIKTVDLSVETKEFTELVANINEKTTQAGGYIETSNVSGSSYHSSNLRNAYIVVRIPEEKLTDFIDQVEEAGNVISKNEYTEDITLSYVDLESRITALEVEQERLLELLAEADSVDSIIELESRLSEIRYSLESYHSQLRVYDNQVTYSTVSIDVTEVERITETAKVGTGQEIWTNLKNNTHNVIKGLLGFIVALISSLPYIVVLAVLFAAVITIWRAIKKKKAKSPKNKVPKNPYNPYSPMSMIKPDIMNGQQPDEHPVPQQFQNQENPQDTEPVPPKQEKSPQDIEPVPPKQEASQENNKRDK